MKLLFDAQCIQSTSSLRGIGRYSLCLLRALAQEAGDSSVEVLLNGGGDASRLLRARATLETFLSPQAIHVFDADWPWRHEASESRRQGAEAAYAATVASLRADVLLVGSVFEGDRENVLSIGVWPTDPPTAAVLYDLIPASDAATYLLGPGEAAYWRRFEQLRRSDLLLSISHYSASQARQLMGSVCPDIATVWGGPYPSGDFPAFEPQIDEVADLPLPARFLLTVGGDHPRKNLDRLVRAWSQVPTRHRAGVGLVIACSLNPGTVRRLRRLARRNGLLPEELILTGGVSERRLQDLYDGALAFVFPSIEEGLGMPPLEAMAAGCPTMLARSSSLVELADDEAAFFDGQSADDIAQALHRLVIDADFRRRLVAAAEGPRERLTWAETARRAWAALRALPRPEEQPVSPPVPVGWEELADLPSRPGPVSLDAVDLQTPAIEASDATVESPYRLAGGRPGLRAALAPATALCVRDESLAHTVASAGIIEHPIVAPEMLNRVVEHDFYAALRPRLTSVELRSQEKATLINALYRPPRWMLQRLAPVWLHLSHDCVGPRAAALREVCVKLGVDLVAADPHAWGLARSADLVAVEAAAFNDADLIGARCRGTVVIVVHAPGQVTATPAWCHDAELTDDPRLPHAWRAIAERWLARWPHTTGWPWQDGG